MTTKHTSPIFVRKASKSDAGVIAELGARTFADTFAEDNDPADMAAITHKPVPHASS